MPSCNSRECFFLSNKPKIRELEEREFGAMGSGLFNCTGRRKANIFGRTFSRILLFQDLFSPSAGGQLEISAPLSRNAATFLLQPPRSFISTRKIGLCTETFERTFFSLKLFAGSQCCIEPSHSQKGKF